MQKFICDKCGHEMTLPTQVGQQSIHKVQLRVEAVYHASVTLVDKEWCGNCVKETLGEIPEPNRTPTSAAETLFDRLVEEVAERVREEN